MERPKRACTIGVAWKWIEELEARLAELKADDVDSTQYAKELEPRIAKAIEYRVPDDELGTQNDNPASFKAGWHACGITLRRILRGEGT